MTERKVVDDSANVSLIESEPDILAARCEIDESRRRSSCINKMGSNKDLKPVSAITSRMKKSISDKLKWKKEKDTEKENDFDIAYKGYFQPAKVKFKYQVLKNNFCATGVKPDAREMYLDDEEFKVVMGMDRVEWLKLEQWKRNIIKK